MTLDEFLKLPGAKPHDGGPCPLAFGDFGSTLFLRGGKVVQDSWENRDGFWPWSACPNNQDDDIIAYREVLP